MRVGRVDFVPVPARAVEHAAAWSRDALGPPPSDATADEVEAPNVTLSLFDRERDRLPSATDERRWAPRG